MDEDGIADYIDSPVHVAHYQEAGDGFGEGFEWKCLCRGSVLPSRQYGWTKAILGDGCTLRAFIDDYPSFDEIVTFSFLLLFCPITAMGWPLALDSREEDNVFDRNLSACPEIRVSIQRVSVYYLYGGLGARNTT